MRKFTLLLASLLGLGGLTAQAQSEGIPGSLDRTTWTVNVSSEISEGGGSGFKNAITDGNISTYWHSNWNNQAEKTMPHWISIEMTESEDLQTLVFVPRQGINTGFPTQYSILVSEKQILTENTREAVNNLLNNTDANITKIDGKLDYSGYTQGTAISLSLGNTAIKGKYVLFVFKSTLSDAGQTPDQFATCAELYLSTTSASEIARNKLKKVLDKYDSKDIGKTGYPTQESYNAAYAIWQTEGKTPKEYEDAISSIQYVYPEAGKMYRIVSALDAFESTQGTKKAIYANGENLNWGNINTLDKNQYWVIEQKNNNDLVLKNYASNKYLQRVQTEKTETQNATDNPKMTADDAESAGKIEFIITESPAFNLRIDNSQSFHCNNHGNGGGSGSNVIFYGNFGSAGGASVWYLEEITSSACILDYLKYTEGDKIFGLYTEASINALKENINGLTLDKAIEAAQTTLTVVTPKADKYYRIYNQKSSLSGVLAIDGTNAWGATFDNKQTSANALWKIEASETEGQYHLYNANAKGYVGTLTEAPTSKTAAIVAKAEAASFSLIPEDYSNNPYYAIKQNGNNRMNGENNGLICYWNVSDTGTRWYIEEATDINVNLNNSEADDASFASVYFPFDVTSITGATMYTGTMDAEKNVINLTEASNVPAYTPVIIKGATDATPATLGIANATTTGNTNATLLGTTVNMTVEANSVMTLGRAKDGETYGKVGFYTFSGTSVTANRVYMNKPENGANALRFVFGDDDVTGIEGIETIVPEDNNAPVYDLSGRRVIKTQKGSLYIKNGVKYIAQ